VSLPGNSEPQRFCFQCGKLHPVSLFEGTKRCGSNSSSHSRSTSYGSSAGSMMQQQQMFHLYSRFLPVTVVTEDKLIRWKACQQQQRARWQRWIKQTQLQASEDCCIEILA
jgi:hypothetical protein